MSSNSPPKRPRNNSYQPPTSYSNTRSQKNIFKSSLNSRIPSSSNSGASRHRLSKNSGASRHTLYAPPDAPDAHDTPDTHDTQYKLAYNTPTNFPSLNKKTTANVSNKTSSLDFTKAVKTKIIPKQIVQQKPASKTRFNTRIVDSSGSEIYTIGSRHELRYIDTEKQLLEDIEQELDEIDDMQIHLSEQEYHIWLNELDEEVMSDGYEHYDDTEENSNSDY